MIYVVIVNETQSNEFMFIAGVFDTEYEARLVRDKVNEDINNWAHVHPVRINDWSVVNDR